MPLAKRYTLSHDRNLEQSKIAYLESHNEESKVVTGKRAGSPSQQRVFFAENLQNTIDKIKNGNIKITGVTKKSVIERLEARKIKVLSMNELDESRRGPGKGRPRMGSAVPGRGLNRKRKV